MAERDELVLGLWAGMGASAYTGRGGWGQEGRSDAAGWEVERGVAGDSDMEVESELKQALTAGKGGPHSSLRRAVWWKRPVGFDRVTALDVIKREVRDQQ